MAAGTLAGFLRILLAMLKTVLLLQKMPTNAYAKDRFIDLLGAEIEWEA